ncbi:MAG TPA: hypothetical protein VK324_04955, partial [Tepidisphaeraceae bacterium]|nr:hypothetical protein [Tepidisphaeraceae bacterium]
MRRLISDRPVRGGETELVYNDHGDVVREVRTVRDAAGAVNGYQVTVRTYEYGWDTAAEWAAFADPLGVTHVNKRLGEAEFAPFTIAGPDAAGLRYTQVPTTQLRGVSYYAIDPTDQRYYGFTGFVAPQLFQPKAESVLGADGQVRTTQYLAYHG